MVVFSVCVFFSALFWVITELNRTGTFSRYIPVNFINLPKEKILVGELPQQIELKVKGSGARLFLLSLKKIKDPVSVDFAQLKKVRENVFTIGVNNLTNLSADIAQDVEIIRINPDVIFFTLENAYSKTVPVKANFLVESESFYQLTSYARCNPEFIRLTGDSQILKGIDTVYTEKIIIDQLDKNLKQKAELIFPDGVGELYFSSVNKVDVEIGVDKFTDAEREIPIEVINLPQGTAIKLFPEKVRIFFQVGLKSYDNASNDNFHAQVDFKKFESSKGYLKIELDKYPKNIRNIRLFPEKAEFLLRK